MSLFRAGTAAAVIALSAATLSGCTGFDLEELAAERSAVSVFGGEPGVAHAGADCPWGETEVAWECSALVTLDPAITEDQLTNLLIRATQHRIDDSLIFAFDNGTRDGLRLWLGGVWLLDRLTAADHIAEVFLDVAALDGITSLRLEARDDPKGSARFDGSTIEAILANAQTVAGWGTHPTLSLYSDAFDITVTDGSYPAIEAKVFESVADRFDIIGGTIETGFVEMVMRDGLPLDEARDFADVAAADAITFVDVRHLSDQGYRFNSADDAAQMDVVSDAATDLPGVTSASGYESGDGITSVTIDLESASSAASVDSALQKFPEYGNVDEVCFLVDGSQLCKSSDGVLHAAAFRDIGGLGIFDEQWIDSWSDGSDVDLVSSMAIDPYDLGQKLAGTALADIAGAEVSITVTNSAKDYDASFAVSGRITVDSRFAAEIEAGWAAGRG